MNIYNYMVQGEAVIPHPEHIYLHSSTFGYIASGLFVFLQGQGGIVPTKAERIG